MNQGSAPKQSIPAYLSERWIDLRLICATRLVLAVSALIVTFIDPSEPNRFVELTYLALIGYGIYSFILYVLSVRRPKLLPLSVLHWLDIAWYIPLIALSNGTNSIFFYFFFFAILVASFGWGFASGLRVTLVSTLLFTLVGYAAAPAEPDFQLNRLLLRPILLLVLGYMIAFWGGLQSKLIARLQLLKNVTVLSNPRFGVARTIQSVLESLRTSFKADVCILVLPKVDKNQPIRLYGHSDEGPYIVHRAYYDTEPKYSSSEITEEAAGVFLTCSRTSAIIHRSGSNLSVYDTKTGHQVNDSPGVGFLNSFDDKSCFSVPVYYRAQPVGRLLIVGGTHHFDFADVDFVLQVMEQVTGVLENIRLVDSLASDAAGQERRRIAQDIHDSVIQPYIGLQFGLAAVKQKLKTGDNVRNEVEELLALTNGEIADLRNYVGGLRRGESPRDIFMPAVRRFASKFSAATGLQVEIHGSNDLPIYDRLAAELFQMIEEGLSNVRRHSTSSYAVIDINVNNGHLEMQIRNERLRRLGETSFIPRSIADRAAALGGQTLAYTEKSQDRLNTVVRVEIPL